MRKLILLAIPMAFLLSACGGDHYSYNNEVSPTYSEVRTTYYEGNDSRPISTSSGRSFPSGGFPVNEHVTVRSG